MLGRGRVGLIAPGEGEAGLVQQGLEVAVLVEPDEGVGDGTAGGEGRVRGAGGPGCFRRRGRGQVEEGAPARGVAPPAVRAGVDRAQVGFEPRPPRGAQGRVRYRGGEVGFRGQRGRWWGRRGRGGEEGGVEGEEVGVAFGEGEGPEGEAEGDVVDGVGFGGGGSGGGGDGDFGFRHWDFVVGLG